MLIDIHSHILPNLDDGPGSIDETVAMLRVAHRSGIRWMVATPHLYFEAFPGVTVQLARQRFSETVASIQELARKPETAFLSEIKLALGAEHFVGPAFFEALKRKEVLPLNQGRYLLIEFPLTLSADIFSSTVSTVLQKGYVPVLAHVERYSIFQRDPQLLTRFLEMGCLSQLNAHSVMGSFWSRRRALALKMLSNDWISLIASDAHGPEYRPPNLAQAFEFLNEKFSPEQVENWFTHHPRWVLTQPAPSRPQTRAPV